MSDKLDSQLGRLETLGSSELGREWRRLTGAPPPQVGASILRLALAWEIQARALGGLSRTTQQKLDQIARGKTRTDAVQPGMRLVREWKGKAHIVTIGNDGLIQWNERNWASLSAVATAITGTRWSGPAFFGLKQRTAA